MPTYGTPRLSSHVIEVRVADLRQLFNAIDPSPFREKDLDPSAEAFIVEWAKESPHDAPLELLVHVDQDESAPDESAMLGNAVHAFFSNRAQNSRRRLRALFRVGRVSLIIGLGFIMLFFGIGNLVARLMSGSGLAEIIRESLAIGGWVAMWRPLEIFLYDWWPIRAEIRLLDRLARMPVRIAR